VHDILSQNLRYLERRSPILADRLREINPDPSLELIATESGDWTVRKYSRNGSYRFLHSRINPRQEANLWTENQCVIWPSFINMGIGLAYHVFELLEKRRYIGNAYLIEADEGIFRLAMMIHDFSSLMQNPSIHFLVGSPLLAIETVLSTFFVQPFSFHIFPSIVSLYPDIYNPIRESIEKHLCALRMSEGDGVENLLKQMRAV